MRAGLICCFLFVFLPAMAAADEPPAKTNVRVQGDPRGTFRSSRSISLTRVEVAARNVGTVSAQGVKIYVAVPGGTKVALSGPETLEPNKLATYSAEPNQRVGSAGKLKAEAHCANCW